MAQNGKYFMLASQLSGHVIGPEGGSEGAGVKLTTCQRNDNDDKLFWYTDPLSGCLRNKKTGLCLNISGDRDVVVDNFAKGNKCQQFVVEGNTVKNRCDGRVLDVSDNNPNVGASLCVWKYHGGQNQQWNCIFQRPRYFLLKGEASGKVIDIAGKNKAAGTKICLWDENRQDNQLWYEDKNGLIRSKLNDFVFDGSSGEITMQPYEPSNPNRSWVLHGSAVAMLANPAKVLDVIKECCENGANICVYDNRNASNQKFAVIYV